MTVKHTPGPWGVYPDCPNTMVYCDDKAGSRVADCSSETTDLSKEEKEANAKLIAAAPELLEACIKARSAFLTSEPEYDLLTEVIEKATGHKYPETTP